MFCFITCRPRGGRPKVGAIYPYSKLGWALYGLSKKHYLLFWRHQQAVQCNYLNVGASYISFSFDQMWAGRFLPCCESSVWFVAVSPGELLSGWRRALSQCTPEAGRSKVAATSPARYRWYLPGYETVRRLTVAQHHHQQSWSFFGWHSEFMQMGCAVLLCIMTCNVLVLFFFYLYFHKDISLFLLTSLKNLSTHMSSTAGPITDLRTSRNSSSFIPRSSFPPLFLPLLPFGLFSCICVPAFGQVNAFLSSCRCSGLSLSAGLTPQAGSLQREPHSDDHLKKKNANLCWKRIFEHQLRTASLHFSRGQVEKIHVGFSHF